MAAPSRRPAAPCRCSISANWPSRPALAEDADDARARAGGDRPRARLPVVVRQLRPVVAGLRRPVARRLCHRFPDPRPRAGLRRAGRRRCCRRSTICRTRSPTTSTSRTRGNEIAYALYVLARNRQGLDRRPALLRRHAARRLRHAAGQGAARRGLALYGDAPACRGDLRRRRSTLAMATPRSTTTAPTTARSCATAPPCWRSPPRPRRCRRRCRR